MQRRAFRGTVTFLVATAIVVGSAGSASSSSTREPLGADLRDALPELRAAADDYVRSLESFAGSWFDEERQLMVYAFVEADESVQRSVVDRVDDRVRDRITIEPARRSIRELEARRSRVASMLNRDGIEGVALDVRNGGLMVVSSDLAASRRSVTDLALDVPVDFRPGSNDDETCNDRLNCGGTNGRRGGVSLNRSGYVCTSGLNIVRSGARHSTTAGHCWYGSTSGTVTSGTQSYGSLNAVNALVNNTFCDCRLVSTTAGAATDNRVYYSDASKYLAVTGKRSYSSAGDTVRVLGRSTQNSGTVQYTGYQYWGSTCNCAVNGAVLATYASTGGDSGGAVTSTGGSVAVGLHSGRSSDLGRYFEVAQIEYAMNGSVLTS